MFLKDEHHLQNSSSEVNLLDPIMRSEQIYLCTWIHIPTVKTCEKSYQYVHNARNPTVATDLPEPIYQPRAISIRLK